MRQRGISTVGAMVMALLVAATTATLVAEWAIVHVEAPG